MRYAFYKHKLYTYLWYAVQNKTVLQAITVAQTLSVFLWVTPLITGTVRSWNENSMQATSCVISVSGLTFYHCSDTVSWVTGRTSVPLVPKDSVSEQREKENREGWFSFCAFV